MLYPLRNALRPLHSITHFVGSILCVVVSEDSALRALPSVKNGPEGVAELPQKIIAKASTFPS